jgi:hypothetical protein
MERVFPPRVMATSRVPVVATQTPPTTVLATEVAHPKSCNQTHPLQVTATQNPPYHVTATSNPPYYVMATSCQPCRGCPNSSSHGLGYQNSSSLGHLHQELFHPVPWLVEFPPPKVMATQPSPPRSRPP